MIGASVSQLVTETELSNLSRHFIDLKPIIIKTFYTFPIHFASRTLWIRGELVYTLNTTIYWVTSQSARKLFNQYTWSKINRTVTVFLR